MSRKYKRILSLVLALITICSTLGVMAFAADDESIDNYCAVCGTTTRQDYYCYENCINRIIECPKHNGEHDAEEWYIGSHYTCRSCKEIIPGPDFKITYVCLN